MLNEAKKKPNDGVYLDHAASTPIDLRVADAMDAAVRTVGNPSSVHSFGRHARTLVDEARRKVADLLDVPSGEVTFTSGATEANVTGLVGLYLAAASRARRPLRVLASPIEHASVNAALDLLAREHGAVIDLLPVGCGGTIDAADVHAAMRPDTAVVCVMWVNNVIGTVQPVAEIGGIVKAERARRGADGTPVAFFSDAVQALRTEDLRPGAAGVDAVGLSGHKAYGPKGVGALWLRAGTAFAPRIVGGGQESGVRAGTENVPGIVAFGTAAELLAAERDNDRDHAAALGDRFLKGLAEAGTPADVVGDADLRTPGILYVSTGRKDGDVVALRLDADGVAVSSGSACDAGKRGASPVITAVRGGGGGIRVSFGRGTTAADIDAAVPAVSKELR